MRGTSVSRAAEFFLICAQNDVELLIFVHEKLSRDELVNSALAEYSNKEPRFTPERIEAHLGAIKEMFFVRYVEGFTLYLANILRDVLRKQPLILASSEKLSVERLVKACSREELIDEIVEETVSSLSYAGFEKLQSWFSEKGIPLETGLHTKRIAECIAIRNVIVHNRGRADARFLRLVSHRGHKLGDRITIDVPEIGEAAEIVGKTVTITDAAICNKFALATVTFGVT